MTSTSSSYNTSLSLYPHMEGMWKDKGLIVSPNPKWYPRLFITFGNNIRTWKDGINE